MIKTAKNLLSLKAEEALDFFMKSEQFHGFELPEYFNFDTVLAYVKDQMRKITEKNTMTHMKNIIRG